MERTRGPTDHTYCFSSPEQQQRWREQPVATTDYIVSFNTALSLDGGLNVKSLKPETSATAAIIADINGKW